jgi:hypothetical protein
MGYSLNEHGLSKMEEGKKGELIETEFPDERAIFDFLGLVYTPPENRIDGRSVIKQESFSSYCRKKNGETKKYFKIFRKKWHLLKKPSKKFL